MSENQRGGIWAQASTARDRDENPHFEILRSQFNNNSLFGIYAMIADLVLSDINIAGVTSAEMALTCPHPDEMIGESQGEGCLSGINGHYFNPENRRNMYFEGLHLCNIDRVSIRGNSTIDIGPPRSADIERKDLFFFDIRNVEISGENVLGTVTYRNRQPDSPFNPFEGTGTDGVSTEAWPLPERILWGRPRY